MAIAGNKIKRSVFFISDGTAITAETLGHSLLAQFPNVDFDIHIMPYITTEEAAMVAVAEINACQIHRQFCHWFDTLVDPLVRDSINTAKPLIWMCLRV
ncbi:MAG: kinase/pyrophosphorylase [Acinetobacter sp.]